MPRVTFNNKDGLSLTGDLELPAPAQLINGKPRATALFAHCFSCTRKIRAAVHITRALVEQGFAVLKFDFTGLGQSEGDFADSHFSANVGDLLAAAEWLAAEHQPVQVLVGHSLGGTAVLAAAPQIASCRAVATINAPSEPAHVLHHIEDQLPDIEQQGSAVVNLGGRPFRIKQEFVDDVRSQDILDMLPTLKKALLVLHAPADATVSIDHASTIFQAAKHPKSFASLDKADHLLSQPRDSHYAGRLIAQWAEHYIESVAAEEGESVAEVQTGVEAGVTVLGKTADGFTCEVKTKHHAWVADEPPGIGANLGPDPYAHLCAALGACTVMTLNMYARHKKLSLESVEVNVQHDRIHAKDCEDCEQTDGKIDVLTRSIKVKGDLSAEQHQRMLEIADRCPVHRTLENEIKVRSELLDKGS